MIVSAAVCTTRLARPAAVVGHTGRGPDARPPHPRQPALSALVTTQDGAELPENSNVIATIVVIGWQPDESLGIGDPFALWRGGDVASGVITRRLFT